MSNPTIGTPMRPVAGNRHSQIWHFTCCGGQTMLDDVRVVFGQFQDTAPMWAISCRPIKRPVGIALRYVPNNESFGWWHG